MLLTLSGSLEAFVQFLTVLVLFCVVLAITYFTTRWIANYQKARQTGGNIEVIETCKLAPNKYIQIIKLGEKYIAVALCRDTVTKLAELSEDEICFREGRDNTPPGFAEILERAKNWKPKK